MKKYYLAFAFDKECNISKTLKTADLEELDRFSSKFNNSLEIREYFKKEIEQFCEEKKSYIEKIEKSNGRKETGDIVTYSINENHRNIKSNRTKTLYAYHIKLFNYLIQNKELMKLYSKKSYFEVKNEIEQDKSLIWQLSMYDSKILTFYKDYTVAEYNQIMSKWKRELKTSDKYFSTIREVFKLYDELCKNYDLPSLNTLIEQYKRQSKVRKTKLCKEKISGKIVFEKTKSLDDDSEYNLDYYDKEGYTKNYIDNNPDTYITDCDVDLSTLDSDDPYYTKIKTYY